MEQQIKCINIEESQTTLTIVFIIVLLVVIFIGIWYRQATTWSPWTEWSECSGGCGGFKGTRRRTRVCPTMMCEGNSFETESCSTRPCEYDEYLNTYAVNDNTNIIAGFESKTIDQLKKECGKEKNCIAFTTRRPIFEKGRTELTDPELHEGYLLSTVKRINIKSPTDAIERRFYVKKPRTGFDQLKIEWINLETGKMTNYDVV